MAVLFEAAPSPSPATAAGRELFTGGNSQREPNIPLLS
jgi:hypothetical protein